MLFLLDVNVLLYAFREEAPEHQAARSWIEGVLGSADTVAATAETLTGVIRIASDPRIVRRPNLGAAFAFADALLDAGLERVGPGGRHWAIFRELCLRGALSGNDVPDAHLAAVAIEQDATLVTHDRGFDRFPELRRLDPFAT